MLQAARALVERTANAAQPAASNSGQSYGGSRFSTTPSSNSDRVNIAYSHAVSSTPSPSTCYPPASSGSPVSYPQSASSFSQPSFPSSNPVAASFYPQSDGNVASSSTAVSASSTSTDAQDLYAQVDDRIRDVQSSIALNSFDSSFVQALQTVLSTLQYIRTQPINNLKFNKTKLGKPRFINSEHFNFIIVNKKGGLGGTPAMKQERRSSVYKLNQELQRFYTDSPAPLPDLGPVPQPERHFTHTEQVVQTSFTPTSYPAPVLPSNEVDIDRVYGYVPKGSKACMAK